MAAECVDLWRAFGGVYRVGSDPAEEATHLPPGRRDPWLLVIPCRRGEIFPWGGTLLAVSVDGRPVTARKLAQCGVCELVQDGDAEKTFTFDVTDFEAVAEIVLPRRRRRLTDEQRHAVRERLRGYQFQPRTSEHPREAPSPAELPA